MSHNVDDDDENYDDADADYEGHGDGDGEPGQLAEGSELLAPRLKPENFSYHLLYPTIHLSNYPIILTLSNYPTI